MSKRPRKTIPLNIIASYQPCPEDRQEGGMDRAVSVFAQMFAIYIEEYDKKKFSDKYSKINNHAHT